MIIKQMEENHGGLATGLGNNYFYINSNVTFNEMLEDHMAAHELGHCNGLDEIAINIGEMQASPQTRKSLAAAPGTLQFSSSNVMGYRRKLGSDITPPNIDFHSWQILLLRKNIQVRISNKRQ